MMDDIKEIPEKPDIPEWVDKAFDAVLDYQSDLSMERRFDDLLQTVTKYSFYLLERQRKTGKKKLEAEEEFIQECHHQLKMIERCFTMAKKHGRIVNKPNENYDTELLGKIISMKGTMGDIVQTVPPVKKEA